MLVNRNRYARIAQEERTIADIENARILKGAEAREARQKISAYVFEKDDEETKFHRTATAINIGVFTDKNGKDRNNAVAIVNGKEYDLFVYGISKECVPEFSLTAEQIKKAEFGYCKSGGEYVTDCKETKKGLANVVRVYVNLASIK